LKARPDLSALSPEQLALLQRRLSEKKRRNGSTAGDEGIPRRSDRGPAPLSFGQERMWFIDRLQPGSPAYNVATCLPLTEPLDVAILERAVGEIVRRHEVLRTTFVERDGRPVQRIGDAPTVEIPIVDLRREPEEEPGKKLACLAGEEARTSFDLAHGPVWRAGLARIDLADGLPWYLFLTMHHIVSDAWSLDVFSRELVALYPALASGAPSPLPELPIQYADFAVWQREWARGPQRARQLEYWRERLEDVPTTLELPTDHLRPAVLTYRGGLYAFRLESELLEGLKALGRSERATLFMAGLTALLVLLGRYTREDDLVVGTPIANRGRSELEGLIGFFLNTLVLRADLGGDPGFRELLRQVREVTVGAYANQDLPFELLVEEIRPERNLSINPLFQVMFVLQSKTPAREAEPSARRTAAAGHDFPAASSGMSRFDLTLSMTEDQGRLEADFEYSSDLFELGTIERMAGHFKTLLAGALADPDRELSALPILTDAEALQLARWNVTAAPYPADMCIHQLFERRAAEVPRSVALVFADQELTYEALNARANQLGHRLRALGVGPEIRVGLLVERSIEMVVGVLGVLKAGGAFVPLDPAYPKERLAFMLRDCRAAVLLTQKRLLEELPPHDARVVLLDDEERFAAESADNPVSGVAPDHAAYVIYTSGSSGRPKGVVVPHRGACNSAEVEVSWYEIEPGDRVLQFASLSFDASVYEILMAFWGKATLVVAPRLELIPGPDFPALLRGQRITVLPMAPPALAAVPVTDLPDLRLILVMGSDCPPELVRRWRAVPKFFNAYGPTETSMWVSGIYLDGVRTTIGRPIPNTRFHVLDPGMARLPVGLPGELHVGGVGVTRGYLERPGLSAGQFIPDPFTGDAGARLYKTGDLVRYLEDGRVDFLGRIDHQVKIRGFRIELGEVEAALSDHPDLAEVAVLARDDLPGGRGLVAYVTPRNGAEPNPGELSRFLQRTLPGYMVPAAFVVLEGLPRLPSGKVDRRSLPLPDAARPRLEAAYVAPGSSTEERLAAIWAAVLGVERVGVHDNFFQLGGHSLVATQITSRVRDAFGVELSLVELFEGPTVAELAGRIEALPAAAARVDAAAAAEEDGVLSEAEVDQLLRELLVGQKRRLVARLLEDPQPPFRRSEAAAPRAEGSPSAPAAVEARVEPLSYSQERMWFLHQLRPQGIAYNLSLQLPLTEAVDEEALERALNTLRERHEALRTTFGLEEGEPVAVIRGFRPEALRRIDLRTRPEAERTTAFMEAAAAEARHVFDLARGPLFRGVLLRLTDDQALVLLTMHHAVADEWSSGILMRELQLLYQAYGSRQPSPLPPLAARYSDYARWQRDLLRGEVLESRLAFWRRQLADAPSRLDLITDIPRPMEPSERGAYRQFALPATLSDRLKQLSVERNVTLFTTLLAGFKALLYHYTGQKNVVVGTPVSDRRRPEWENVVGLFLNTLVLHTDLGNRPPFVELIRRVNETVLAAKAHQDLPFERLVEDLQPERSLAVNPIFQVMFSWHHGARSLDPGMAQEPEAGAPIPATAKIDLTLHVAESESQIYGAVEYMTDLYDDATAQRLARHLINLLERVAENPERPISEISLLGETEARELRRWNETQRDFGGEALLHRLIERQAAAAPEAEAVIFEDEVVTYRELDRRASRLARHLHGLGIGPDVCVGVYLERSSELVVALLGVLKAGGAYVPLEPSYPAEHLRHMLEKTGLEVVLTLSRLRRQVPRGAPTVLELDRLAPPPGTPKREALDRGVRPQSLAYVIFTSGSTGKPKGAMNTHRAITNRLAWMQDAYRLERGDRVLQKTPIGFDVSVWELFWPLTVGAALVLARPGSHTDSSYLAEVVRRRRISTLHFVPPMLQVFLRCPDLGSLPSLRRVLCSGEALPPALVSSFYERLGGEIHKGELHNLYGPTEAAVDVTSWACPHEAIPGSVPIGRPIANVRIHLLSRALGEQGVGVPGELLIGGPTALARGYVGAGALTAERFVPDPVGPTPGGRLYRTGDLARYLPGGDIEFLGRIDHQVKIRGVRIELGEIESVLREHPEVREAVVEARRDRRTGLSSHQRLVAHVVPEDARAATARDESLVERLRAWLVERLPLGTVPSGFVLLERLPLTANGKLDRRALAALEPDTAPAASTDRVAPRNAVEEVLAEIWAERLDLEEVGTHDDFFRLGGHSLLAIQVLSRLRDLLEVDFPFARFFTIPTVAQQASELLADGSRAERIESRAQALLRVSRLEESQVETMLRGSPDTT